MVHEQLTETIIGCAFKVANTLGCGFLEKVYENPLAHELRKAGLKASTQVPIPVNYDGIVVGDFVGDIIVEETVILELKAIAAVVVGGTAITGGRGSILGTLIGVALLGTIGTALVFMGINPFWEKAIQGAIILAAVVSDVAVGRLTKPHVGDFGLRANIQ